MSTKLYDATSQKMVLFKVTAVRTSNLMCILDYLLTISQLDLLLSSDEGYLFSLIQWKKKILITGHQWLILPLWIGTNFLTWRQWQIELLKHRVHIFFFRTLRQWTKSKQEILGITNCLLSFDYILNIWYDTDCMEKTMSNHSSIVICVFVTKGNVFT